MSATREEATERGKKKADAKSAERTAKNKKGGKGGKDGKKGKKGGDESGAQAGTVSVAAHPRAAASVKRTKGLGGLAGFVLAAVLSRHAGLPIAGVVERALLAGMVGYLIAWACAVAVWRQLVLAEIRAFAELHIEQLNNAPRPALISDPPATGAAAGAAGQGAPNGPGLLPPAG